MCQLSLCFHTNEVKYKEERLSMKGKLHPEKEEKKKSLLKACIKD